MLKAVICDPYIRYFPRKPGLFADFGNSCENVYIFPMTPYGCTHVSHLLGSHLLLGHPCARLLRPGYVTGTGASVGADLHLTRQRPDADPCGSTPQHPALVG